MNTVPVPVVSIRAHEILNYFGKCPECGYAARGTMVARKYADGGADTHVEATCELPCGWSGPAVGTLMTGTSAVVG